MREELESSVKERTMNKICFTVYGVPLAQGRPRFKRIGNHVQTFDPQESRSWKESVRAQAIQYLQSNGGVIPIKGGINVYLFFFLPRPKSLPKKVLLHLKKPDLDNLTKLILDALRGICYKDDSQIVRLLVTKQYGEPHTDIAIYNARNSEDEPVCTAFMEKNE